MSRYQKKIMILGAGISQLPAIKKAIELGFYVITVDYLPDNIGHKFSNQFIDCSTLDMEGVLRVARELNIDSIVTFASDVATQTVGFVAKQLDLPSYPTMVAKTFSNKDRFRAFQRNMGLNSPNFIIGKRFSDIKTQISKLSPSIMFKPVDSSGSRGISRIDQINHKNCMEAFKYAQSFSHSKTVCVEEFVEGIEIGGDCFLQKGQIAFIAITHKHMNGYVVSGHSLPTNITEKDQTRVCSEITKTFVAGGYTDGPLNFDVMVSPERITILEMSPRLGGNGIPMIIEHYTGVDLIAATLYYSLNLNVELKESNEKFNSCGSWIFGSNQAGTIRNITSKEELQNAVPEVFEYVLNYNIGDKVPEFIHNGNSLGYILFDCHFQPDYNEIVNRLKSELRLEVA